MRNTSVLGNNATCPQHNSHRVTYLHIWRQRRLLPRSPRSPRWAVTTPATASAAAATDELHRLERCAWWPGRPRTSTVGEDIMLEWGFVSFFWMASKWGACFKGLQMGRRRGWSELDRIRQNRKKDARDLESKEGPLPRSRTDNN